MLKEVQNYFTVTLLHFQVSFPHHYSDTNEKRNCYIAHTMLSKGISVYFYEALQYDADAIMQK